MRKTGLMFLILLAAGLAVYAAGLRGSRYSDDFQFVFDLSRTSPLRFFVQGLDTNVFYRPFQSSFLWLVQARFGMNTIPIHLANILLHAALSTVVFSFLAKAGFTRIQALLGALFMLLSQANVLAVESNDTLSQVGSGLFGYLSLALFWKSRDGGAAGIKNGTYAASLACFSLALWFKESGVSFVPMMALVVGITAFGKAGGGNRLRAAARLIPYLLIFAAYLAARSHAGGIQPSGGESGYAFHLGANVPVNIALCLFTSLSPVSTVTLFAAIKGGSAAALAPLGAAVGLFVLALACGVWMTRDRARMLLLAAALFLLGLFPVLLLPRVGELYAYNSMPAAAALCGIVLGGALQALKTYSKPVRTLFAAVVAGALLINLVSVQSKIGYMVRNGERAGSLYAQIKPFLAEVPAHGKLVLLNPPGDELEYSVFRMRAFNVLEHGNYFNRFAGRDDFSVEISGALPVGDPGRRLVLTLDESGRVERPAP